MNYISWLQADTKFLNVANELGTEKYKVPVLEMPSQTDEIKQMMDEDIFDEAIRRRGITLLGFAVESVTLDEESKQKIDDYELSSNAYMQQGKLVDAYANAVQGAATNSSGSMNGFMGIGMMNMSTNGMMGGVATTPWQNTQGSQIDLSKTNVATNQNENQAAKEDGEWTCECGIKNDGKFCVNCGKPKDNKKECPKCKTINERMDKFCSECGEKLL